MNKPMPDLPGPGSNTGGLTPGYTKIPLPESVASPRATSVNIDVQSPSSPRSRALMSQPSRASQQAPSARSEQPGSAGPGVSSYIHVVSSMLRFPSPRRLLRKVWRIIVRGRRCQAGLALQQRREPQTTVPPTPPCLRAGWARTWTLLVVPLPLLVQRRSVRNPHPPSLPRKPKFNSPRGNPHRVKSLQT
jgi:hypothetical protein